GILTALVHSPHERVFVVGCDMPLLNPSLVRYMAQVPDTADVLIPRWTDEAGLEQLETLHAIYTRRCIEPIRKKIQEGKLKAADLLEDLSVCYLREDELRQFDPNLTSFRNINTSEEWIAMRT